MIADTTIKRPALRWYGGKWDLSNWIISFFPDHNHYVEPCFGAGSVLLRKPPVKLETVSDINGRVVNYFQVLRDCPGELLRRLDLTPWAQDEYKVSQDRSIDPLEDARRFHIMCWMSIHGGPVPTGFRQQRSLKSRFATPASDLVNHDLEAITKRLRNVQILSENALHLIEKLIDKDDPLIYFDPPYIQSERTYQDGYLAEYEQDEAFHIEAAELLRQAAGYVVVSGYACPLYAELYEAHGWRRVDKEAQTNSGGKRIESLWLSPRTVEALNKPQQLGMFNGGER